MFYDEGNCRCTFEGKRVALSTASLVLMEGRLVGVPHFGLVAMMVLDDHTHLVEYKPEDLQSLHQDISRDLELSIWPPLGQSVLVQQIINPLGIDDHMFGFDVVRKRSNPAEIAELSRRAPFSGNGT